MNNDHPALFSPGWALLEDAQPAVLDQTLAIYLKTRPVGESDLDILAKAKEFRFRVDVKTAAPPLHSALLQLLLGKALAEADRDYKKEEAEILTSGSDCHTEKPEALKTRYTLLCDRHITEHAAAAADPNAPRPPPHLK